MGIFRTYLVALIFAITSTASAGGNTRVYIVQTGDSLSVIADRIHGGHTYGHGENLEKILRLNPQLNNSLNIFVGQKIFVPEIDFRSDVEVVATPVTPVVQPAAKVSPVAPVAPVIRATAAESQPTPAQSSASASAPVPVHAPVATTPPPIAPAPVAIPVPAKPVPAPVSSVEVEDIAHHAQFDGGYQFTNLHAEDLGKTSTADLFTSRDVYVRGSWQQSWSETFSTFASLMIRNLDFLDSTNNSKHLSNTSQTMVTLTAGGTSQVSERTSLLYSAAYGHELFVHGLTTTNLQIDSVAVPHLSVGGEYRLLKKGLTSLGVGLDGGYVGGASTDSYNINSGYTYRAVAYLRRQKNGNLFGLELGFAGRYQETSILNINEQSIFGNLQYSFDLFEGGHK